MNHFEKIEKELNFSKEWFENFKLKTPSYYHIESYVNKLYEVIKNYEANTEDAQNALIRVNYNAYTLKADLAGELKGDYERSLVRYRDKWISYHQAIDTVKKLFLDVVKKDLS